MEVTSRLGVGAAPLKRGEARRMSTGFVGNYIHETSMGSWYNYNNKRQRPFKLTKLRRNRTNKMEDKAIAATADTLEEAAIQVRSSESGYDTTGDTQVPRVNDKDKRMEAGKEGGLQFNKISSNADTLGDGERKSRDVVNVNDVESSSLRKLLRDLNRCDVSIRRYQDSLQQHCIDGENEVQQMFSLLHRHLQTREYDLLKELAVIRQTAGSILERRKATLDCLRETVADYDNLAEEEVDELSTQIKQFVTDRKVDEEIGNVQRYCGDVDDILPYIMGFGKINNVRHLYTEWEEFPKELIIRSKTRVTFLPTTRSAEKQDVQDDDRKEDKNLEGSENLEGGEDILSAKTESIEECKIVGGRGGEEKKVFSHRKAERKDKVDCITVTSPIGKRSYKDIGDPLPSLSPLLSPGPPSLSSRLLSSLSSSSISLPSLPLHHSDQSKELREESGEKRGEGQREKYSPEEMKAIQARVKSSLENQGVFLYDPVTGAGPLAKKGGGEGGGQKSDGGGVESEGRRSEGEDHEREEEGERVEMVRENQDTSDAMRKKKTPTQLRRERKKRQKERERRQRDLEKMGSEESDIQVTTPPPPYPPSHRVPSHKAHSLSSAHTLHPSPTQETVAISTVAMAGCEHAQSVGTLSSLAAKVMKVFGSLESEPQSSFYSSL